MKITKRISCYLSDHDFRIKWQSWDGQTKIGMRKCAKCGHEQYYKIKEGKDDEKDSAEN
jgi:Zn ribbon nucleic-acid-binding protein